jgi:hypothetical protein
MRESEVRRLLTAAGELTDVTATADPLSDAAAILHTVAALVPADRVSWSRLNLVRQEVLTGLHSAPMTVNPATTMAYLQRSQDGNSNEFAH